MPHDRRRVVRGVRARGEHAQDVVIGIELVHRQRQEQRGHALGVCDRLEVEQLAVPVASRALDSLRGRRVVLEDLRLPRRLALLAVGALELALRDRSQAEAVKVVAAVAGVADEHRLVAPGVGADLARQLDIGDLRLNVHLVDRRVVFVLVDLLPLGTCELAPDALRDRLVADL